MVAGRAQTYRGYSSLLARFTSDPLAADRIMRLKHDELGDTSIAEALRKPKTAEIAWRMLTSLVPELPDGYSSRSTMTGPSAYAVDRFQPAARYGEWTRTRPPLGTGSAFPKSVTASIRRSGAFRTRYAGATLTGAFREQYRSTGLVIPADHRTHHLVRLVSARNLRVLDLRTEKNLDVLEVDDQISTGQHLMSGPPAIDLSTPPGAGGPISMRSSIGRARRRSRR